MTDIHELITRRRRQILVHSYLYYGLNANIISDHVYDEWSKELADLQRQYPEIANTCEFAEAFANFDGSTGFDLPKDMPWLTSKALQLLRLTKRGETNE